MGVQHPNSTGYVHPDEPNLLNLHKAMEYDEAGVPHVRVRLGADNITITGNVNLVDNVRVNNTEAQSIPVYIVGNVIAVNQNSSPWVISANSSVNSNVNPIYVNFTNANISLAAGSATIGNVGLNAGNNIIGNVRLEAGNNIIGNVRLEGNLAGITGNIAGVTGNIAGVTGNIAGITGNIAGVTGNVNVTQGTNPWHVDGNVSVTGGTVQLSDFPDAALTAFDEPLAIGITPIIQADAMYGLDPDFWITTELNNGNVTVTGNTTWQVQSGTSAGGYARLATSKYMTYQPGQGSMFRWTAAFTTTGGTTKNALGIDNIVQNTGPVDREDGYSFGYSGASDTDAHRKIGILHRRAGKAEIRTLTVTVAPTGNQTATVTLNGTAFSISLTASTSVNYTANQIANALKAITAADNTWDIEGCNGLVTFTYYSPGPKSGTYSFSSSGSGTLAMASFSQTIAGVTPTDVWTYVDDWDNQTIQFDPTKLNVFGIDFRWLGSGRVRFFMENPSTGKMVLVHTQKWTSQYTVPHLNKPSLRLIYRSGTTNTAITPSQNVIVTGASVFSGVQGMINQTGSSQGYYNIDSTTRAKDTVWHLMSIQNPFVRNSGVNKASIALQSLTVAAQSNDPSVIYVVKNAVGLSDVLVFNSLPNTTNAMFVQYSVSAVSENLSLDRISNVQTLGINGTATFDLMSYNLNLAPGETVSVFISSSNALNRTAIGMTWNVD